MDLERKAKRAARVRKLSHRAQRKEFLREHSYPQVTGRYNSNKNTQHICMKFSSK